MVSMAAARTMEPIQQLSNVAMMTNAKLASAVMRPATVSLGQLVLKISTAHPVSDAKPRSADGLARSARRVEMRSNVDSTWSADCPTPASVIMVVKSAPSKALRANVQQV